MAPPEHSGLVHATDEVAEQLDELEFTLGEGPAREAFRRGYPIFLPGIGEEPGYDPSSNRWPAFSRAASQAGAGAVFALPLQLGAIRVGALLLYRVEPGHLDPAGLGQALRVADAVTYAVVNLIKTTADGQSLSGATEQGEDGALPDHQVAGSDQIAYRAVVHQAVGVVSHQLGVSLDEALARMRAHAYADDASLTDIAQAIVARELRLER